MDFTTPQQPSKKAAKPFFSISDELAILKFLWFRSDRYLPSGGFQQVQLWLNSQQPDKDQE